METWEYYSYRGTEIIGEWRMSVNKAILIGNLGRDPEVRATKSGSKIVSFSLATSEKWKDRKTGDVKERTEWHRIVIFDERLGEVAEKYLRKGSKVYLSGQVQTRKWQDGQGTDKYTTEIVLSSFKSELQLLDARETSEGYEPARAKPAETNYDSLDDEIPF